MKTELPVPLSLEELATVVGGITIGGIRGWKAKPKKSPDPRNKNGNHPR
jgi:hypothetical protein